MRPRAEGDDETIRTLFLETCLDRLAALGLEEAAARAAAAGHRAWLRGLPGDRLEVLAFASGALVGMLVVRDEALVTAVLDLRVSPSHRGRGIGRALLAPVLSGARRAGRDVQVRIDAEDAVVLEACLDMGFEACGAEEGRVLLRRPADPGAAAAEPGAGPRA